MDNKQLLPYILNENNVFITKDYIHTILGQYGVKNVKIDNLDEFKIATVHVSYLKRDDRFYSKNRSKLYAIQTTDIEPINDINKAIPLQENSYERHEFLGDAVLHLIIADYECERYPNESEGFLTKLRSKIENSNSYSYLSKKIGLGRYAIISRHMELKNARVNNDNLLEDIFEAFIGALYNVSGYNVCKEFMYNLIEKELNLSMLLYTETNFKEKLGQFFHIKNWVEPCYGELDVSGPENGKIYTVYVKCKKSKQDEGEIVGIGIGSKKKDAEQDAAKKALEDAFSVYMDDDKYYDEYEEMSDTE